MRAPLLMAIVLLSGCAAQEGEPDAEANKEAQPPASWGSARLAVNRACSGIAPFYCAGFRPTWGRFSPGVPSSGALLVSWNASQAEFTELDVQLVDPEGRPPVGGILAEANGASPLTLDADVPAGEYQIRFYPTQRLLGPAEQVIDWRFDLG